MRVEKATRSFSRKRHGAFFQAEGGKNLLLNRENVVEGGEKGRRGYYTPPRASIDSAYICNNTPERERSWSIYSYTHTHRRVALARAPLLYYILIYIYIPARRNKVDTITVRNHRRSDSRVLDTNTTRAYTYIYTLFSGF